MLLDQKRRLPTPRVEEEPVVTTPAHSRPPGHTASGLDRRGRDRTDQRAAALLMVEAMHLCAAGDPQRAVLRDQVVAEYLPFARYLASRYGVPAHSTEDLQQVAYLGLVKAVDGFDLNHGAAFLSYATPTIVGEIKRYFRDVTWAVHVPRRIQELSIEVHAATETLTGRLNRAPTVNELAVHLRVDVADVIDAIDAAGLHNLASLDLRVDPGTGEGSAIGDLLGHDDAGLQHVLDRETVRPLLAQLSAREKQILLMRFFRGMTQTQMGIELGVSQMQVSRLLTGILGRLRQSANADGSRDTAQ